MTDDIFDFGFTAVSEEELEVVQKTAASAEEAAATATVNEDKLNKLYNAILPLLSNLKLNPEKDYIYWPNRTEKVEQFEEMIANIIK
tara:strand:- start:55 stop:315 length:261 start_codon:yes stop_codon:yes gene_type:complete